MKKKVLIIDGMGLIFRAYYSFIRRPLLTSTGKNTSAIFGFFKMINRLIKDYDPFTLVMTFDVSRHTFRSEIYPEYKAHRPETAPELGEQIPLIKEIIEKMGMPFYYKDGYEADDVIGTLAEKWKDEYDVRIVTGDKDLFQLVSDNVSVVGLIKGVTEVRDLDRAGVKELKGVYPEQIPDYLAIVGDSSDNIPGVKGIGDKGAVKLLEDYADLEEVYAHLEKIKGANQLKLQENKENAFLSKTLAIIKRDVPIDIVAPQSLDINSLYNPEVIALFEQYEMGTIAQEILKIAGAAPAPREEQLRGKYFLITQKEDWEALKARILSLKRVSFDFETTSKDTLLAQVIGVAFSVKEKEGFYVPLMHEVKSNIDPGQFWKELQAILEDPAIKKVGQNLKYEIEILQGLGITLQGMELDTMVGAYLNNSSRSAYNMDVLARDYLDYDTIHYGDVIDPKTQTLLDADITAVRDYAAEDADITLRLANRIGPEMESMKVVNVWQDIEAPLIPVLADMEREGILLDRDYLGAMSVDLGERLSTLERQIYEQAGHEFNINSPKQLGVILYEELNLPVLKKTGKTKQASTDESILQKLARMHPLPALLLEYRTFSKLKSTYVDALPLMISEKTGRVHTSYQQTIAATGRLSSIEPNLQNIPIKDELGRQIRQAFIAREGYQLLSIDYSQIELRLFAHLSEDPSMIQAFKDGIDIHSNTAAQMYGIPVTEVGTDQRRAAKTINYGISYGMGPYSLSAELGISVAEARDFIERYFEKFPGMRDFMAGTLEYARQHGEIRTMYGRRRPVPELQGKEIKGLQNLSHPQRYAINTVVQGSAADIIKLSMIRISEVIKKDHPGVKLLLQIHDELVFEVPETEMDAFKPVAIGVMESVAQLKVPLVADAGQGRSWGDAH